MYNKYQIALRVLASIKKQLNIVIVGANDGKTNDPIYNFNMKRLGTTNVLLIEPNQPLLPYLQKNYSPHPSYQIANCAIGKEGILTLYAVKQKAWKRFQPAYAEGWPVYRAATGVTSAIKSHVEKALIGVNLDPDKTIDILKIPAKELKTLLNEIKWPTPIDVLQIDAEGYDDVVIYNSNISFTKPKIIYFESHNMPKEKAALLKKYLVEHRYVTYVLRGDSLAVQRAISPTCILLNMMMLMHSGLELILHFKRNVSALTRSIIDKHNKD